MKIYDTLIIGGGQAGLSVAYYLKRTAIDYLILDDQAESGGGWLQTWDQLKLFSPVQYSSLSGWMMPKGKEEYPSKDDFIHYLTAYEKRYKFPINRQTRVTDVEKKSTYFHVHTTQGDFFSKTIVSATGTAQNPFIPIYQNRTLFKGVQIHSSAYKNPTEFINKKVLIVGGGNSGAQILAEVAAVAQTKWVTLNTPRFLPEHIDGRYLFNAATQAFLSKSTSGEKNDKNTPISLGDIVVVESVKKGLEQNIYNAHQPFKSFYEKGIIWENGEKEEVDAVIWCTGFKANLAHLSSLNCIENNRIETTLTRSVKEPALWLVGYGNWTGFASATIYGVGKTARQTAKEIVEMITNYNEIKS